MVSQPPPSEQPQTEKLRTLEAEVAMYRAEAAAASEILRTISSTKGDVQPVFDAILKNAATLCSADQAALQLVNEAAT